MTENSSPQPDGSGPTFSEIVSGIGKLIGGLFNGVFALVRVAFWIALIVFAYNLATNKSFSDGLDRMLGQEAKRMGQESRGEHVDPNTEQNPQQH